LVRFACFLELQRLRSIALCRSDLPRPIQRFAIAAEVFMYFDSFGASGVILFVALCVFGLCLRRIRGLNAKPYAKWRRICEGIGVSLVILIAVATAATRFLATTRNGFGS
jgi:hypothetical protein